jgi:hypothetical protein
VAQGDALDQRPVGRQQDQLVTGVTEGLHRTGQRVGGPHCDLHPGLADLQAVLLPGLVHDRLDEGRPARRGPVGVEIRGGELGPRHVVEVRGGRQVGVPDLERDHVAAKPGQPLA